MKGAKEGKNFRGEKKNSRGEKKNSRGEKKNARGENSGGAYSESEALNIYNEIKATGDFIQRYMHDADYQVGAQ